MSRKDIALSILQSLMLRYKEDGYSDMSAIVEAFTLADKFIIYAGRES